MTLREFLYWNRLAQMECRKTPLHMAIYIVWAVALSVACGSFVVGTTNPLLLFNPNFQPSMWVRLQVGALIVALALAAWLYLRHAVKNSDAALRRISFFTNAPALDAPFHDPEN
jgi:hypothetical protein